MATGSFSSASMQIALLAGNSGEGPPVAGHRLARLCRPREHNGEADAAMHKRSIHTALLVIVIGQTVQLQRR